MDGKKVPGGPAGEIKTRTTQSRGDMRSGETRTHGLVTVPASAVVAISSSRGVQNRGVADKKKRKKKKHFN